MNENVVNEKAIIPAENAENLSVINAEILDADDLITVMQLPVIAERLKSVKPFIEDKVSVVLALDCNEDTVKAIKVLRAELTKIFEKFEERRKAVKQTVSKPYDDFNEIYKDCVTTLFKGADSELKKRIDEVENAIKAEKRQKAFIDRINDDLQLIYTQEHSEEILVEYKRTLNASAAIMSVSERHKAIEAEREYKAQVEAARAAREEAAKKVEVATIQPRLEPPVEAAQDKKPKGKLLKAKFPFTAMIGQNRDDLVAVKKAIMEAAEKHNVQLITF